MKRSIAVIFHENERETTQKYVITKLVDFWKQEGIDVTFSFGTKKVVPADLAILHVNLSVVPEEYLEYARQYPFTLNGTISDIRKSSFSTHIIHMGDKYAGKVMVKSDLNHAGLPERNLTWPVSSILLRRFRKRLYGLGISASKKSPFIDLPKDYLILDSPEAVPPEWYERKDIVIEQFLPEIDQDRYCIRNYTFLGDRHTCFRRYGTHPVVNGSSATGMDIITVHPAIVALRTKMKFAYGKFDYVMQGENPVLLDINKTPGISPGAQVSDSIRREWAAGIFSYFDKSPESV